jgi:hypothetical protein
MILDAEVKAVFDMIKADAHLPDDELIRASRRQVKAEGRLSRKQLNAVYQMIEWHPNTEIIGRARSSLTN